MSAGILKIRQPLENIWLLLSIHYPGVSRLLENLSTAEGWKPELTLEPCGVFEHGTLGFRMQNPASFPLFGEK